jgi:hypothetical protein
MTQITLSTNSLLIINKTGLKRLQCPFNAICILMIDIYLVGDQVSVIAVKTASNQRLVYIIQGKAYFHHYFVIADVGRGSHPP